MVTEDRLRPVMTLASEDPSARGNKRITQVSTGIILLELANPLQKLLCASLLKETHERGTESFTSVRRDLGNGGFGALSLLYVTSSNLSKLKVSCDVGGNQNVCQFTVGHEQLGDQVHVPVVHAAIFLPWLLAVANVSVCFK